MDDDRIAWHPAFYEAIQAELEDYRDVLEFHSEYQLTSEPLKVDVLVVKKAPGAVIKKNIAEIFRSDNLIEYKSPEDYVSVDDFYKVYGYACLYASFKRLQIQDVTISFVETRHPRELLEHLQNERRYEVEEKSPGIYRVYGDVMPIQVIESKRLSPDENLWLKSLNQDLDVKSMAAVFEKSIAKGKDARIKAYMNVLLQANSDVIVEVGNMAKKTLNQALEELGLIQEWEEKGRQEGEARGVLRAIELIKSGMNPDEVLRMYPAEAALAR
jgi:hypothetical protein